ncbi:ABC transporter ATP-binding protein [Ornithinibacillus halotolerans]|uniref:ABC transporter ATP-binding protein n=1 Tax=Ornithinibacillus halotolerans TaxID=1274357 RepID=A0A916WDH3_9BACI|nr:ABC transporter ATP-binding protein [Ornithinibacillus halotolerans]GGA90815.1 ABC transporter ATP-binding protein [Ornithinibacillus halotolerans]
MNILEVRNVVKVYGEPHVDGATTALNNIELSVDEGEFIAIMGPSGSGKTTLLNILSGIDKPTSGEIVIRGQNLNDMKGDALGQFRRTSLGYIFQDFNLLESLTVKENIMLPMILEKKKSAEMEEKVQYLAKLFQIESILNKYPYNVSGGQQQRAAVSRALVNEPQIIFADEPTGNLDSKSSTAIMECLERVVQELSTTVLLVTHDVFAASYCHRVVFIRDGTVHSSIEKKSDRKQFFNEIMVHHALLGGSHHDI